MADSDSTTQNEQVNMSNDIDVLSPDLKREMRDWFLLDCLVEVNTSGHRSAEHVIRRDGTAYTFVVVYAGCERGE